MSKLNILFGVNGMGLGHLTHAFCLYPTLKKNHNVDVLVSGLKQKNPFSFPIKKNLRGVSFVYKNGGVSWIDTLKQSHNFQLLKDIANLDLSPYDLILSDFEPITAWAAKFKKKPCINISHQASMLSPYCPIPKWKSRHTWLNLMKLMSPCKHKIGLHFKCYDDFIMGPLIKENLKTKKTSDEGHILVYLSAFSLKEQKLFFKNLPKKTFHIFHNQCEKEHQEDNLICHPIHNEKFQEKMLSCHAFISQAGFDSIAEVLFLKKPVLVMPIKNQFEQYCNAAALQEIGVVVLNDLDHSKIKAWIQNPSPSPKIPIADPEIINQRIIEIFNETHN